MHLLALNPAEPTIFAATCAKWAKRGKLSG